MGEAAFLSNVENRRPKAYSDSAKGAKAARDVPVILTDLRQSVVHTASLQLAVAIQGAMAKIRPRADDHGVRQAPFDVLQGLQMPAVLVEVGYIDHPLEGLEMMSPAVQCSIADALAAGIAAYLKNHLAENSQAPAPTK